jgi:hypothetical protein
MAADWNKNPYFSAKSPYFSAKIMDFSAEKDFPPKTWVFGTKSSPGNYPQKEKGRIQADYSDSNRSNALLLREGRKQDVARACFVAVGGAAL